MKKTLFISLALLLLCLIAVPIGQSNSNADVAPVLSRQVATASETTPPAEEELRGVWIASVYNIDYPSKPALTAKEMATELDTILDNVEKMNMNALFFQVRPSADALYQSEVFPWSAYLTGKQGQAPLEGFDPLQYLLEEGHKRNIEIHAWVNPYKITRGSESKPAHDLNKLAENHPARLNPEIVVAHPNGELYFDPGHPKSRSIVLEGIKEIATNYDIDGIHYDDYFYPSTDFADEKTYAQYQNGFTNKDEWRRNNVNLLIKDTYTLVKSINPTIEFGVSPAGIWANKNSNPLGSETKGMQTYYDQYADSKKWIEEGWVDYIAPQIYWNIGYKIADYAILVDWWSNITKNTDVKLYIGHAAYRLDPNSKNEAWRNPSEIPNQLKYNKENGNVDGSIFYGYGELENNTLNIKNYLMEHSTTSSADRG